MANESPIIPSDLQATIEHWHTWCNESYAAIAKRLSDDGARFSKGTIEAVHKGRRGHVSRRKLSQLRERMGLDAPERRRLVRPVASAEQEARRAALGVAWAEVIEAGLSGLENPAPREAVATCARLASLYPDVPDYADSAAAVTRWLERVEDKGNADSLRARNGVGHDEG